MPFLRRPTSAHNIDRQKARHSAKARAYSIGGLGNVKKRVTVHGFTDIAAQQAVVFQNPEVASLRDRLVRRLGHRVRIGEALVAGRRQNLR